VDLLGDGYSNFAWEKYLLLTSTNEVAINGTFEYGQIPVPATFDPLFEAYKFYKTASGNCEPFGNCSQGSQISASAFVGDADNPAVMTAFTPLAFVDPWPLNL
jgi:hypothetical protein